MRVTDAKACGATIFTSRDERIPLMHVLRADHVKKRDDDEDASFVNYKVPQYHVILRNQITLMETEVPCTAHECNLFSLRFLRFAEDKSHRRKKLIVIEL